MCSNMFVYYRGRILLAVAALFFACGTDPQDFPFPDTGTTVTDAGHADAATPDAGSPDAGDVPDAGPVDAGPDYSDLPQARPFIEGRAVRATSTVSTRGHLRLDTSCQGCEAQVSRLGDGNVEVAGPIGQVRLTDDTGVVVFDSVLGDIPFVFDD